MKENNKNKNLFSKIISLLGDKVVLIIALVILIFVFTLFNKNYFTKTNMINILVAASLTGLVAIGETYLIIAGLVDLSPGSVAAFASVLSAVLLSKGVGAGLTILIVLISGAIVGIINAFMINRLELEPFIATLVSMSVFRGAAYIICGGKPVYVTNENFIAIGSKKILSISIPVIILIIAFIVFGIILSKTKFGRNLYVIGGNEYAARLAGIDSKKVIYILYIIMGVLASLGGVILAARMNSGQPSASVGLEFDAITAAVLGGTAMAGGVGTMFGTVLGVLILQGFNTGLIMLYIPVFWQNVARGVLLFVALTLDFVRREKRRKKMLQQSMDSI